MLWAPEVVNFSYQTPIPYLIKSVGSFAAHSIFISLSLSLSRFLPPHERGAGELHRASACDITSHCWRFTSFSRVGARACATRTQSYPLHLPFDTNNSVEILRENIFTRTIDPIILFSDTWVKNLFLYNLFRSIRKKKNEINFAGIIEIEWERFRERLRALCAFASA